jgi:hypothetical protein
VTLAAADVADQLGLDDTYGPWLAGLSAAASGAVETHRSVVLPGPDDAAALLARLGCGHADIADTVATLPDPKRDPARWWLLERSVRRLAQGMGDPTVDDRQWPRLPAALGVEGGCFHLHLYLAALPAVQAWHGAHGVPEDISWASLADLGRHVAIQRLVTGTTGIDEPWWMMLHLRGLLLEIGRLQYIAYQVGIGPQHPPGWLEPSESEQLGDGFRTGDPTLAVHIPAGGRLEPAACEASYAQAKRFYDSRFPSPTRRVATCSSWLLDDQLAAYLPAGSNILAFARPYHLTSTWIDGDQNVLGFVFFKRARDPGDEPRTPVERAVVDHLAGGGHFRWRTGWRDLVAG